MPNCLRKKNYFSTKTYVVDTQKNRLNETVLLSSQKHALAKHKITYKLFMLKSSIIWTYEFTHNTACWDMSFGGGETFHNYDGLILQTFFFILYIPVNIFSVMSGQVFLGRTSTKHRIKCVAKGHNAVSPVRTLPTTNWSHQ